MDIYIYIYFFQQIHWNLKINELGEIYGTYINLKFESSEARNKILSYRGGTKEAESLHAHALLRSQSYNT